MNNDVTDKEQIEYLEEQLKKIARVLTLDTSTRDQTILIAGILSALGYLDLEN